MVPNQRNGVLGGASVDHLGGANVNHLGHGRHNRRGSSYPYLGRSGRHLGSHRGYGRNYVSVGRHGWYGRRNCNYFRPRYSRYRYCRPYVHNTFWYSPYRYWNDAYWGGFYGGVGVGIYTGYPAYDDVGYETNYYDYSTDVYQATPAAEPQTIVYDGSTSTDGTTIIMEPVETQPSVEMIEDGTQQTMVPMTPSNAAKDDFVGPPAEADASISDVYGKPSLIDQGNAAFNQEEYEAAVRFYMAAILEDDSDGYARLFYGLGQFALGDYGLSAIGFRRALVLAPDLVTNPIDLRSIYQGQEQFDAHVNKLKSYLGENPEDWEASFVLGYVYFASAAPDMALAMFQTAKAKRPDDALLKSLTNSAVQVLSSASAEGEPEKN
ncbi:MAG: tetratricopeptide repeat protein [Planctomycetota bacterium]